MVCNINSHPYSRYYIKTMTCGGQEEGGKEVEGAGWKGEGRMLFRY